MDDPSSLHAVVGPQGLVVPYDAFAARLGGRRALSAFLQGLTVVEKLAAKPGLGRPEVRRAYEELRGEKGRLLALPRSKLAPLSAARTAAGGPLLDSVTLRLPSARQLAANCGDGGQPLYADQTAVVELLCGGAGPLCPHAVERGDAVAYLCLDTGCGKSRVGGAVIARRREPGLVVVPTCALADQWLAELNSAFPRLRAAVYRNGRRRAPTAATHDVVIVVVNTFRDKDPPFLSGFGTIVLDEAHEYHSPCNSRALWLAQARAVLGLSATPLDRPDGLDRLVVHHLGRPVVPAVDSKGAAVAVFRGSVRKVEFTSRPDREVSVVSKAGTVSAIATIAALTADPERLRLVVTEVVRLLRRHEAPGAGAEGLGPRPPEAAGLGRPAGEVRRHGVFVFAEFREYLPALRAALAAAVADGELYAPELEEEAAAEAEGKPVAPGGAAVAESKQVAPLSSLQKGNSAAESKLEAPLPAGSKLVAPLSSPQGGNSASVGELPVSVLRGGVGRPDVERAARARVVLTTYGFSRRGISLTEMTAMVLATPRRNGLKQITGRILRRGSDPSICRVVVDIVDARSPIKTQFATRRQVYNARGFTLATVLASWEDFAPKGGAPEAPQTAPPALSAASGACGGSRD